MKGIIKICVLAVVIYVIVSAGVSLVESFEKVQSRRVDQLNNVIEQINRQ